MVTETKASPHEIAVLRGKIAYKTGAERQEALQAYWHATGQHRRALEAIKRTDNLPITSQLRYSGTTFVNSATKC